MKTAHYFIGLFLGLTFLISCKTPQKAFEKGNYDESIQLSIKKLRSRTYDQDDIKTLIEAFNYVQERDNNKLKTMLAERNPARWAQIYDLSRAMNDRQEQVRPLLQMNDEKYYGMLDDLTFYNNLTYTISQARDGAAEYAYNKAMEFLNRARRGERLQARTAYEEFQNVSYYLEGYKDTRQRTDEAYYLGINHVFFKIQNDSRTFLPADFEAGLRSIFVRDINSKWVKFHTSKDDSLRYEYDILTRLTAIEISPELIDRSQRVEERDIEDGFDYEYDASGKIKKDTLGNEIKVKRYSKVRATVFEVAQRKEAKVIGYVEYYDNRTGEKVLSKPFESNSIFNNIVVTFDGDKRALSDATVRRLGGKSMPFPSDADMLIRTTENVKDRVKRLVRDNIALLEK
jgi:hypothetical protein